MNKEKTAAPGTGATALKPLPKKIIALQNLLNKSMNQLEAWNAYNETCFHNVISDLSNNHSLVFKRTPEIHHRRDGNNTWFMRYELIEESRESAEAIIKFYQLRQSQNKASDTTSSIN